MLITHAALIKMKYKICFKLFDIYFIYLPICTYSTDYVCYNFIQATLKFETYYKFGE